MASSYLRNKRAADRKVKQKKLEQYVRKEAARALKAGKAYRPKGKNAEERAMMDAVVEEVKAKMEVTDKVAKDAACRSKKAMACSSKAMAAVKKVAASEATTKTEVEKLRKRQEELECKQEIIGSGLAQAMEAEALTGGKAQAMAERVAAMGTGRGRNEA